jgi:hypothetical protein
VAFRPNLFAPAKTALEGEQQSLQTDKQTTFKLDPRKKIGQKYKKKSAAFSSGKGQRLWKQKKLVG